MHIKKQTVIPANVRINRVDAGVANATPLRVLRARAERSTVVDSDQGAEMRMERYHMARGAGLSESDALDESNGY